MDEVQFNQTNFILLKDGKISEFNQQRKKYPNLEVNLNDADLTGANHELVCCTADY